MTMAMRRFARAATATLFAATVLMTVGSNSALAQEQCSGPFASYDAAVNECLRLNSIGYCLPQPDGYNIIRQDDLGFSYCCCIGLVSAQPKDDSVSQAD